MTTQLDVQIRWLIRRDMPEVMTIERASFPLPWDDEDFLICLRTRNCIGMVAEANHKVVGFMIYELHNSRIHILNFAVDPEARRQGVGRQMVKRLFDKLTMQRRREIRLTVRESNLVAQLFFAAMTFRATYVDRGHFEDTGEDAYHFRYTLPAEKQVSDGRDRGASK